jgi:hypothetical protein
MFVPEWQTSMIPRADLCRPGGVAANRKSRFDLAKGGDVIAVSANNYGPVKNVVNRIL